MSTQRRNFRFRSSRCHHIVPIQGLLELLAQPQPQRREDEDTSWLGGKFLAVVYFATKYCRSKSGDRMSPHAMENFLD